MSPPAYNTSEGTSDLPTLPLYTSDQYSGGAISCSPYRHGGGSPPYRHGGGSPPPPPYPGCSSEGAGTGTPLDDIHMEDDEGKFSFLLRPPPFLTVSTYPFFIVLLSLVFLPLSLYIFSFILPPDHPIILNLYSSIPIPPTPPPPSLPPLLPLLPPTPHPSSSPPFPSFF